VPDAEGLKEQKQESPPAVEQPRSVRRLTTMFEAKIKQQQVEWKQGRKPEQPKEENESAKVRKPKST